MNIYPFNRRKKNHHLGWKIAGGVGLAALAAAVIASFSDIKRYIRISTM